MSRYNVLVSSVGGDVGQAVCKALRFSEYNIRIIGTDCRDYKPAALFCDNFRVIHKAHGEVYRECLCSLMAEYSVDLVYICSEQELFYICEHYDEFPAEFRARFAISSLSTVEICRNKFKTSEFLRKNNLPYPESSLIDKASKLEEVLKGFPYPLVVKKITDSGSKSLHIVDSIEDIRGIKELNEDYMLQEYIPGTEYTNAVFRDSLSEEIFVISMERSLKNGVSDEVKVVFDEEIKALCKKVALKLGVTGSINIQLRKPEGKAPVIFEINPRYSSTTFMRARFGFNDVIFTFKNLVLHESNTAPKVRYGEAYRYLEEYFPNV